MPTLLKENDLNTFRKSIINMVHTCFADPFLMKIKTINISVNAYNLASWKVPMNFVTYAALTILQIFIISFSTTFHLGPISFVTQLLRLLFHFVSFLPFYSLTDNSVPSTCRDTFFYLVFFVGAMKNDMRIDKICVCG